MITLISDGLDIDRNENLCETTLVRYSGLSEGPIYALVCMKDSWMGIERVLEHYVSRSCNASITSREPFISAQARAVRPSLSGPPTSAPSVDNKTLRISR